MWVPWGKGIDEGIDGLQDDSPVTFPSAMPSGIDAWLIATIYDVIVSHSLCTTCGAGLRPELTVTVSGPRPGISWRVIVEAKCRSLGRHRNVAHVVDGGSDLLLGKFGPVRGSRWDGR